MKDINNDELVTVTGGANNILQNIGAGVGNTSDSWSNGTYQSLGGDKNPFFGGLAAAGAGFAGGVAGFFQGIGATLGGQSIPRNPPVKR